MMAEAIYLDGQREILCSVPNYDFNWQTTYTFTNPPYLPAGTRLVVKALHDNTKDNPNNPNPNSYVRWGQATYDEMMHGWTDFVYAEGEGVWPTSEAAAGSRASQADESAHEPAAVDRSQPEVMLTAENPETPSLTPPEILRHMVTSSDTRDSSVLTRSGWIPSLAKVATVFTLLGIGAFVILLRR